jgi:hypothetical protein
VNGGEAGDLGIGHSGRERECSDRKPGDQVTAARVRAIVLELCADRNGALEQRLLRPTAKRRLAAAVRDRRWTFLETRLRSRRFGHRVSR